jgi:hypothetical protein
MTLVPLPMGVHTIGMRYPIDIVFVGPSGRVVHLIHSMKPYRISPLVWNASLILEQPAGVLLESGTEVGDQIELTTVNRTRSEHVQCADANGRRIIAMQIQFPRRVQLGFRPWHGLTLRQLFYLAIAGRCGALVLFNSRRGGPLVRALAGIGIISIGVAPHSIAKTDSRSNSGRRHASSSSCVRKSACGHAAGNLRTIRSRRF